MRTTGSEAGLQGLLSEGEEAELAADGGLYSTPLIPVGASSDGSGEILLGGLALTAWTKLHGPSSLHVDKYVWRCKQSASCCSSRTKASA